MQRYRTEILIFLGAFVVRALYVLIVQLHSGAQGFISQADAAAFYYRTAINLVEHGTLSLAEHAPFYPAAYHTPLYPVFLSVFLFLGVPLFGIALLQMVLSALTVVCTYLISIDLTASKKIAVTAAVLAMFEPMSIYWGALLMSDTLFAFLLTGAFFLLVRKRYYWMAIVLGFTILTRPIALLFTPVFLVMVAYRKYGSGIARSILIREVLLVAVLVCIVVAPWVARNKIVFNQWGLTSAGWYELYVTILPDFAQQKNLIVQQTTAEFAVEGDYTRFDFKYIPEYKSAFMDAVSKDPVGYFYLHLQRSIYSLVSNRFEYLVTVFESQLPGAYSKVPASLIAAFLLIGLLFWPFIYILGFAAFSDRRLWPWLTFFIVVVGINTVISGAINPRGTEMSRYTLGFTPLFFTFAGVGAQWVVGMISRKRA